MRAVAAFDCGAVVNPDGLRAQISGGIIQGIGGDTIDRRSLIVGSPSPR